MTQYLPANLLALFAPREPILYLPPIDIFNTKKRCFYTGVGQFLDGFEDPKDTPPVRKIETREERKERIRKERAEKVAYKLEKQIALWDPHAIRNVTNDPFKTLFISRINYDTSESKLKREFEVYGPIKKIVMVNNVSSGKPRGYAFIEYEHEKDMHSAYKYADGKKIDGRRVLVDVERARTVKGWLPRRLGGGLGGTRRGAPEICIKHSGREDNERERERYRMEREREERGIRSRDREHHNHVDRDRRRSRSRDKRDRRKSRTKSRSKSRDRERERRHKKRDKVDDLADNHTYREKDKDKEKKRKRSRSREHRTHKKDKKERDRDRDYRKDKIKHDEIQIKQEPLDDYQDDYKNGIPYDESIVKYE